MTIKAQKWKFWNFSEFTLFLRDSKNSKFNKFSVKIMRCFFAIIAHFACKTKSRENASFEGFFGMFRSQPHIMTHNLWLILEEDAFDESPTRSIIRRKSIIREPGRKSSCSNRKNVTFGSLPTELTVRSAKDCLKHMFAVS